MIRSQAAGKGLGSGFIRTVLGVLLVYTTWVWAGLRPSFHWVAVLAAIVLLARLFLGGRSAAPWLRSRDPVFLLGLAFLGFLILQWVNAGRTQYFDVGYQRWVYSDPRWPDWPSAFSRADALQMLTWFFPAWVIALAIRSRILDRHELRGLLMLIACNAGLLAIFGLVQFAMGNHAIYGMYPLNDHFFASFAYGNHAAPYFVLAGALTAGLLYREVFDSRRSHENNVSDFQIHHPWKVAVLVPNLLLCLMGANLGLSRSGVILAWTLGIFVAGYGLVRGWRMLRPAARVNFGALVLAAAGLLYFAVAGFGAKAIQKEFKPKVADADTVQTVWDRIDLELGGRPEFALAAIAIWQTHPWLGVGGWGYKYLVAERIPEDRWWILEKRGWANVHCDFLQFLAEFGVVGFGLLLGALGVMVREVFRRTCRHDSAWVMGLAGLFLVGIFSVIDLPFRCPAILYTWVAALAVLSRICEDHAHLAHPVDGGGSKNGRGHRFEMRAHAEREFVPERTGQ